MTNTEKLPVADQLLVCQQQTDSDSMLFLRAVTAAGLVKKSEEVLVSFEFLTDSFG